MNKIIIIFILLLFVFFVFTNNSEKTYNDVNLKEGALILAFGDSLTEGYGVNKTFSYPAQIEKKTNFKVINGGVSGEISSDGLSRLPSLLKKNPDLVILCHGGNDILRKLSSKKLKTNLLKMIKLIKKSGAKVLLIGVPNFSVFGFSMHEVYQEVADETDVMLESEILSIIESDNSLKSDYIHPNEEGYEMMANSFIQILDLKVKD